MISQGALKTDFGVNFCSKYFKLSFMNGTKTFLYSFNQNNWLFIHDIEAISISQIHKNGSILSQKISFALSDFEVIHYKNKGN